jgi:hypothetical protein
MATNHRRTGTDHLTVVPEDFEPPEDVDADDAEASAESGQDA